MRATLPAALLAGLQSHRGGFSKIKGLLRKTEARTREALVEAMGTAISAVTAQDARGYFEHSGYRLQIQSL